MFAAIGALLLFTSPAWAQTRVVGPIDPRIGFPSALIATPAAFRFDTLNQLYRLALQLQFSFGMSALCGCLMGAPPERPRDDERGWNAPFRHPICYPADFLD